ncbi:MAG: cell division protein FtsA [Oligoflexales bacterium]
MEQLFALDLGTTKFCLATLNPAQPDEIDTVCIPAAGMKRGMVASYQETKKALLELISTAEEKFATDISTVHVGIAGAHLWSRKIESQVHLNHHTVNLEHIYKLKSQIPSKLSSGHQILHQIPMHYQVDQRPEVLEPQGLSGQFLHGQFLLIGSDFVYARDVIQLCNDCGLRVKALFAEPYASAQSTVHQTASETGVTVADIGGGTTDGICFRGGKPIGCFTINVGGEIITNDLAIGLGVSKSEAEHLKHTFGVLDTNIETQVSTIHNDLKHIKASDIQKILKPRLEELSHLILQQRLRLGVDPETGLFLTGGGADLKGLPQLMENQLNIHVSRVRPTQAKEHHTGKLATSIGLLSLAQLSTTTKKNSSKLSYYAKQFFDFIKELS